MLNQKRTINSRGIAEMKKSGKAIAYIILTVSILFVAAGVYRDEISTVVSNATLICYSCIGLK